MKTWQWDECGEEWFEREAEDGLRPEDVAEFMATRPDDPDDRGEDTINLTASIGDLHLCAGRFGRDKLWGAIWGHNADKIIAYLSLTGAEAEKLEVDGWPPKHEGDFVRWIFDALQAILFTKQNLGGPTK